MMSGRQCCLHSRSPARETKRPTCEATERAGRRRAAGGPVSRSDVISAGVGAVREGAQLIIIAGVWMEVARRGLAAEGDYYR